MTAFVWIAYGLGAAFLVAAVAAAVLGGPGLIFLLLAVACLAVAFLASLARPARPAPQDADGDDEP